MSSSFSVSTVALRFVLVPCVGLGVGAVACGGQAPAAAAPEAPAGSSSAAAGTGDGPLTAARCEAAGGKVVGDIGDGATHRPDYKCESGKAPLGSIVGDDGKAVGIEGSVCCL